MFSKQTYHTGLSVIGEISRIISDSSKPEQSLQQVANLIAGKYHTDVCSIYIIAEDMKHLVLRATKGLSRESIGKISMRSDEGLAGLALETMKPVFIVNPSKHPRYKYFQGSGEEQYKTFLALPLIYHQDAVGVLVVQTRAEGDISESDIKIFSAIASQISSIIAYAGTLSSLKKEKEQSRVLKKRLSYIADKEGIKKHKKTLLRGEPVSGGFGEGYAHYIGESIGFDELDPEMTSDSETEIKRFEQALASSNDEILRLIEDQKNLSIDDVAVLNASYMTIRDTAFKKKVVAFIKEGYAAEYALKKVVLDYLKKFSEMSDPYLRERGRDIEDAGRNILRNLLEMEHSSTKKFKKDTIIIASDLSPADVVALKQKRLRAIVLSKGGQTSHTAILAKSFEIPMVINVKEVVETVKENNLLIVDGISGVVFANPSNEIIIEYQRLKDEKKKHDHQLNALKNLPAVTKDGFRIMLGANIGLLSDLQLAKKYGAEYIGLYRTEFPFIARDRFPSENEQFRLYTKIVKGFSGKEINIRTLDVGGDKFLSYHDYPMEKNPYLGWRSIRISLELDEIFRAQIRAILKASAFGKINLLFPMITSVSEVKKIRSIINDEKIILEKQKIPFNRNSKIGIMIEVPAAVRILDKLLDYVDFVSIGTNDLIQYTLAVDRNNPKVASIYNPLHPAMISTILDVVSTCKKRNKSVSICGESAANPRCAFLFLAMETDCLSMNPCSVPVIKDFIRKVRLKDAKDALEKVLEMEDTEEITNYIDSLLP